MLLLTALLIAAASAKPEAPARAFPESLPERPFTLPEAETRELSNGLRVVVARNDEVPTWDVRLALNVGAFADPDDLPGLAGVTFDLLTEGAGDRSAEDISRELKRLASSLGASANSDGATVSASGILRNLEPTLDLWAKVIREPSFEEDDFEILQRRRIADRIAREKNPSSIASRAYYRRLYGDRYIGHLPDVQFYEAMSTADIRRFYQRYVGPENAIVLVGGAVDADVITALLEERLGDWRPEGIESPKPDATLAAIEEPVLYFVHHPGAAQSVLRVGTALPERGGDDHYALDAALRVLGGGMTGRVNMNLREDKGYTYGAYCGRYYRPGPSIGYCTANVDTANTLPALVEMRTELRQILADRPIDDTEISKVKQAQIDGYPRQFETPGALLGDQVEIWQYGLPADWTARFVPGMHAVTAEAANTALRQSMDLDHAFFLVVGDRDEVYADLATFGLPVVELDKNGDPLATPTPP